MSNRVKRFHMAIGVDLIGSKTSMAESRNIKLEATAIGIKMYSNGSNRTVVIPYSNVKGFEMYPEDDEDFTNEKDADYMTKLEPLDPEVAPKRRGRPPKV